MNFQKNPQIIAACRQITLLLKSKKHPILIALDGRSGTGKSSIAKNIANKLGGAEITADDFYTGGSDDFWDSLSPREKAEMVIDWKRLRREVLEPLISGKKTKWHPFNWGKETGLAQHFIECSPKPLIILDGAYSCRPELSDIIDLSILVIISEDKIRRRRLIDR